MDSNLLAKFLLVAKTSRSFTKTRMMATLTKTARRIPLDCLVEFFGLDAVNSGQVGVQHDPAASDKINAALDAFNGKFGGSIFLTPGIS